MYICDCCGTAFDEPRTRRERFTDDGRSCYLYEDVCPWCGEPHFHTEDEETEE